MNNINKIYCIIFVVLNSLVYCQDKRCTLLITNEKNERIIRASVEILTSNEKYIFSGLTNNIGELSIPCKTTSENFRIRVKDSNFKDFDKIVNLQQDKTTLIVLTPERTISLDEVFINSKLKSISRKGDKLIMNINGSKEIGNNAVDIIQNAPGISIDKDEISFLGKEVLVEIDGKRVMYSNQQLINYLKSQNAQTIKSIELIQNPSSRYSADFDGRVINIIKLKEGEGYNISIDGTYTQRSKHPSHWAGIEFNYYKNNLNIYGGTSYLNNESTEIRDIDQTLSENKKIYKQNSSNMLNKGPQYNLGVDWYLSKSTILGINTQISDNKRNNETNGYSEVSNNNELDSLNLLNNIYMQREKMYNVNLNFKTEIDTLGTIFNFDFDFGKQTNKYTTEQYSTALINNIETSNLYINQFTDSNNQLLGFKADLRGKVKNLNYSTGLHFNQSKTKHFLDEISTNSLFGDETESYLNYDENIYAGYIDINGKKGALSYSAGLRLEMTDYKGYSNQNNSNISDTYTKLFPQISLGWKFNKGHYLSLSWKRRIKRPRFSELIPFKRYTDTYSYSIGNPNLIAFYPNIGEIYYSYKNGLWSNISYEFAKHKIIDYYSLLSDSITTISTKGNIGKYQKLKFAVGYNKKIADWFNYRSSISYTTGYEAILDQEKENKFNYNAYTLWVSPTMEFEKFSITPNFYYSSDVHYNITKTLNYWYLDFDIRYSLNDNMEFSFIARDLFLTGITRNNSRYQDINIKLTNNWDSRLFIIGFSYFIGNDKVKSRKRESTANKDTLNRL